MTKDEARTILENSEETATWKDENAETWNYHVGEFYQEFPEAYGFLVYPYSSTSPINPNYAFLYFIYKDTKKIECSTSPFPEENIKKVREIENSKS